MKFEDCIRLMLHGGIIKHWHQKLCQLKNDNTYGILNHIDLMLFQKKEMEEGLPIF
jgi:hypothetical protein